jgi:hypothetical protein
LLEVLNRTCSAISNRYLNIWGVATVSVFII